MPDWDEEAFLRRLQDHLTWARARLHICGLLRQARQAPETVDALDLARLFFFMSEEALYLDAALTVEKLYSGREERSIRKYLNKCIHDYEELKLKDELTRDRIHGHVDALDEHGDVFDTLQTMRDEWLAHHDSEAFDDPHAFMQEYSVSLDELGELVHTGQSILEEHYLAHGVYFSPGLSRESDLLGLIDILVRYKEAHDMRYKHNSSKDDIMKKIFHKDESRIEELRDKFDDFRQ